MIIPSLLSCIFFFILSISHISASTSIQITHDNARGGLVVNDGLMKFDGDEVEKQIPIKSKESLAFLRVVKDTIPSGASLEPSSSFTKLVLTLFQDVPQHEAENAKEEEKHENGKHYQLKTSLGITMPSYVTDVYIQIGKIQEQMSDSNPIRFIQHFSLSFFYSSPSNNADERSKLENLKSKTVSITTEASPISYKDVLAAHTLLAEELKEKCGNDIHKLCKTEQEEKKKGDIECLMENKKSISELECLKVLKIIENEVTEGEVDKTWINGYQIPFHELETVSRAIISFEISIVLLLFCLILLLYISREDKSEEATSSAIVNKQDQLFEEFLKNETEIV